MKNSVLALLLLIQVASADEFDDLRVRVPIIKNIKSTELAPSPTKNDPIEKLGVATTGCLGECPVYKFIVSRDGTFVYEGGAYSKRKGRFTGTCYPDLAFEYAASLNLPLYADQYLSDMTDHPGISTLIKTKSGGKVIFDDAGVAPLKIRILEDLIQGLMMDATWKKTR